MVWSYHCSETCFSIVFPAMAFFDHIYVGYPAVFRATDFYRIIVPVGSVIYPVFEESSITPCRVAVSSTQLKERSSAPLPVGRVLYAGWRLLLI